MRGERERLLDILEAIQKIGRYPIGHIDDFADDEQQQVWVIHHLQIIGEAANGISRQFRNKYPQIPWDGIIGMRHVLVHGYFEVDLEIVWAAVERDLPALRQGIEAILSQIKE